MTGNSKRRLRRSGRNATITDNNHPIRQDFNQYQNCILPEEVLEMIFGNLDNPQDLVNISKTCPQFERILRPSNVAWLFDEVLPFIYESLGRTELCSIRATCKNWNKSVCNLLDNHYTFRPYDPVLDKDLTPPSRLYKKRCMRNYNIKEIDAFELGSDIEIGRSAPRDWLEKMKDHHGNPFVLRHAKTNSVDYGASGPPSQAHFWEHTFAFLKKYGMHIHYFKMLFQDREENYLAFYKTLRKCLQLMPNLRTIHLSRSYSIVLRLSTDYNFKDPYLQDLKKYIKKYPLPEMSNLSAIYVSIEEFNFSISKRVVMDDLFRRYQRQVKKVKIDPDLLNWRDAGQHKAENMFFGNGNNNLTELHLQINSYYEKSNTENVLRHMHSFTNLGKLTINTMHYAGDHNIQNIMESLETFSALKVLNFVFWRTPTFCSLKSRLTQSVQLSSVKVMDVRCMDHHVGSSNFYDAILCHVPCLEYLHIFHPPYFRGDIGAGDELFNVMRGLRTGSLYQPKLWSKLKCLKVVSCGENTFRDSDRRVERLKCFTREKYDQLKIKL